ncbi:MAG: SMI1/KNR4 family protein [Acidimicrobiia bacterium]|nr:SMI1/KNR4 family protein [Acidimicrobiia bacterium]
MLDHMNGFYAFESALHVFPSGTSDRMSLELWNAPDLWRRDYDVLTAGLVFFAEDVFGGQFALSDDGVGVFDPETGDVEAIAPDLSSWAAVVMGDYDLLTGYPIAHDWQVLHGPLVEGERLVPKLPFVTGGAFEVGNLYASDAVEGMRARAHLAIQIRDLPDGTQITYRIVE